MNLKLGASFWSKKCRTLSEKISRRTFLKNSVPVTSHWTRTGIWNEIYDRLPGDMAVRMREVLAGCWLVILVPRVTRLTL